MSIPSDTFDHRRLLIARAALRHCTGRMNLLAWDSMRILSGIQPSGALHLGNYFGMMRPAIDLQEQGDAYYFIANYHS